MKKVFVVLFIIFAISLSTVCVCYAGFNPKGLLSDNQTLLYFDKATALETRLNESLAEAALVPTTLPTSTAAAAPVSSSPQSAEIAPSTSAQTSGKAVANPLNPTVIILIGAIILATVALVMVLIKKKQRR